MDTKLKNNNLMKKFIITPLVLIIIIFASLIGYLYTGTLSDELEKDLIEDIFSNSSDFPYEINRSNLGLYYETLKLQDEKDPLYTIKNIVEPSKEWPETIDDGEGNTRPYVQEDYDNEVSAFNTYMSYLNNSIWTINQERNELYANLQYYAKQSESGVVYKDNNNLLSANMDDFLFYFTIEYDKNGDFTITDSNLPSKQTLEFKKAFANAPSVIDDVTIKNMTFTYGYPKFSEDLIYDSIVEKFYNTSYQTVTSGKENIGFALVFFVFILVLIIPFKFTMGFSGCKVLFKIPIELLLISINIIYWTYIDNIGYVMRDNLLWPDRNNGILLIPIYFFILTLAFFYFFMALKYIFTIGIKEYLKKHSLLFKIGNFLFIKGKENYKHLTIIDLKNKNTKSLVFLLIINLIVVSLLTCLWFFGIIGAVIYSIVLFFIIIKKYNKIMGDYNKLLKATHTMVHGDLNSFPSKEDMGIFNSLRDDLQNIEKGFKKAVDLEVQSQKMKTELITNVSHDLKTPLTAIISYIDLLKEENINSENSKEYIETLEMKAQRLKFLIEDLFEVSKATSGNVSLNIEDVDVVSLIKQTLVEQEQNISSCGIQFKTNFPSEKVILPLDGQRSYRIFENLIVNITKYGLENSRAYIDVVSLKENEEGLNKDVVEITIKNISREEMNFTPNEILERFVRGDKSRNTAGSGLGLAISKSFVELHGGTFDILIDGDLFKVIIKFNK